jgi:predicted molibdopterin-dependent oxidoreductase YjgC
VSAFTFDGTQVPYREGQTVAGALLASGTRTWRTTRGCGRSRGIFCGIGVCFDCLVEVDGVSNQRACLLVATDSLMVRTQDGVGAQ